MHPLLIQKLEELLCDNAEEYQMLSQSPYYVALRVYGRFKQTTELIQGFVNCGYAKVTEHQNQRVAELRTLSWEVVSRDADNPQRITQQCVQLSEDLAALFGVTSRLD